MVDYSDPRLKQEQDLVIQLVMDEHRPDYIDLGTDTDWRNAVH